MKRILKIAGISIVSLVLLLVLAMAIFAYKAKYGINFYSTDPIELRSIGSKGVLIFSQTNGFRHGESIEYSIPLYQRLAEGQGWDVFVTDDAGVFNKEQLSQFKVVVWNNTSGKVLKDDQRKVFKQWINTGGGFVGVHAAGDDSHQWDWYADEVLQAHFSHHNIGAYLDTATMYLEIDSTNLEITDGLDTSFELADEWYCFFDNPREKSSTVIYTVDESTYNLSGNMGFLVTDKNWGMGDHPVAWYHAQGAGRVFYTSLGHSPVTFQDDNFQKLLTHAINWAGDFND